jgi:hypothetical protein
MNKVITAILVLCLSSLACELDEPDQKPVDEYVKKFGGSDAEYERILSLTDCASLEAEFDQAEENAKRAEPDSEQRNSSIGYMIAADDRMEELECDDDPMQGFMGAEESVTRNRLLPRQGIMGSSKVE